MHGDVFIKDKTTRFTQITRTEMDIERHMFKNEKLKNDKIRRRHRKEEKNNKYTNLKFNQFIIPVSLPFYIAMSEQL